MPNVTNVALTLQHGGAETDPNAPRTVSVTFTTVFNSTEILAEVVFRADVTLRPVDGVPGAGTNIGSAIIKAAAGNVSATVSKAVTRHHLDEDPDFIFVGRPPGELKIREDADEWLATVTISPVVFGTATRDSGPVQGSWGNKGVD